MSSLRFMASVAISAIALLSNVFAAPYANAPSTASVGRTTTVTGGGFEPGTVITIRVLNSSKSVSTAAVVVAQDGSISHPLQPAIAGPHAVQLFDASGKSVASEIRFLVSP